MKALIYPLVRMPRWLLWALAPMAVAAAMSTCIDVLQASTGDGQAPSPREPEAAVTQKSQGLSTSEPAQLR